jgi:UTP--glucose-1-phosphate uridylyltransferase
MTHDIKPIRTAVFPVAGLGTRFLPATKAIPKEMLTLLDRPLIHHAVEEARAAGIEKFVFVIGNGKDALVRHFDEAQPLLDALEKKGKTALAEKVRASSLPGGSLHTTLQEEALGLGHAVWCAKDIVGNEPFAVLLPDDVVQHETGCMAQMVAQYNATGGNMVAVEEVAAEDTNKYGILKIGGETGPLVEIKGLVEKPAPEEAPSRLAIIGRYILQPEIFDILERRETGAGGEIQLTDAMAKLLGVQPFHGFRFAGTRFDCGSKQGFIEANIAYALQDPDIGPNIRKFLTK